MMTTSYLKWPDWQKKVWAIISSSSAFGVKHLGTQLVPSDPSAVPAAPVASAQPPRPLYTASERRVLDEGEGVYKQLCFACHGLDGNGTPLQGAPPGTTMGPPLRGSKTANGYRDGVISVVLKGLNGPVNGSNYTAQMVPMESNDDAWVASVISYIRNNFGNRSTFITTNDVARVRAAIHGRTNAWTLEELHDTMPQPMPWRQVWRLTASHNGASLGNAIDGQIGTRYDTHASQIPGMWVQIELPEPTEITGVELDAGPSSEDYPRGYKVQLSDDGVTWGQPVAAGNSTAVRNQILFPTASAKFVRITQTGSDPERWWSIHELQILKYLTPDDLIPPPNLPAGSLNTVASEFPAEPLSRYSVQ
jgi:mono/diheme cytochrome c family protein